VPALAARLADAGLVPRRPRRRRRRGPARGAVEGRPHRPAGPRTRPSAGTWPPALGSAGSSSRPARSTSRKPDVADAWAGRPRRWRRRGSAPATHRPQLFRVPPSARPGVMFEEGARVLGLPGGAGPASANFELAVRAAPGTSAPTAYNRPPQLPEGPPGEGRRPRRSAAALRAGHGHRRAPARRRCGVGWRSGWPVVRQMYGTAESGNLGFECEGAASGLHVPRRRPGGGVQPSTTAPPRLDGGEGRSSSPCSPAHYPLVPLRDGADLSAFSPRRVLLRPGDTPAGRLARPDGRGGQGPRHVPPTPVR